MAETLDYRSARVSGAPPDVPVKRGPRVVIPIEFDTIATRTQDLGGAHAVEVQFQRCGIPCFRCEEPNVGDTGTVYILVRGLDGERAIELAGEIFARRERVKLFPVEKRAKG